MCNQQVQTSPSVWNAQVRICDVTCASGLRGRGLQAYMQQAATESDRTKVSPDCLILPSPRQLHNQPLSKHSPSQFHPHSSSFGFQQICFLCALPQKYDLIDTTVAWTAPKISFSPRGEFSTTGFGSKNLPRLPLFNIKLLWTESALSKIVGKLNFKTI